MVWMAGDNDLDNFGESNIKEMNRTVSNDKFYILIQFNRMSDDNTRRNILRNGTSMEVDVVQVLGETTTVDPNVAIDFFTWSVNNYPAEHYFAVLCNHGSGIDETDVYRQAAARGFKVLRKVKPSTTEIPRSYISSVISLPYRRSLLSTTVESPFTNCGIA